MPPSTQATLSPGDQFAKSSMRAFLAKPKSLQLQLYIVSMCLSSSVLRRRNRHDRYTDTRTPGRRRRDMDDRTSITNSWGAYKLLSFLGKGDHKGLAANALFSLRLPPRGFCPFLVSPFHPSTRHALRLRLWHTPIYSFGQDSKMIATVTEFFEEDLPDDFPPDGQSLVRRGVVASTK